MRWLVRTFANAVLRRVTLLLVAAVLSWFGGMGEVYAQGYPPACNVDDGCTREVALARCKQMGNYALTTGIPGVAHSPSCTPNGQSYVCEVQRNGYEYPQFCGAYSGVGWGDRWYYTTDCPSGQEWNDLRGGCQKSCDSRSTELVSFQQIVLNGSVGCTDGCEVMYHSTGIEGQYTRTYFGGSSSHCAVLPNDCSRNGPGYSMNFGMSMCQPTPDDCNSDQIKDPITGICKNGCEPGKVMDANGICNTEANQCPPGNVKSPSGGCLPGDGQCAVGEARGKDGTCKRDADGDGQPDDGEDTGDTDETFGGGDDCNAPPSCSGSPIMCGQARIQWRIECNTRRNRNIAGGACNAVPICTGEKCDALEYTQLLMQWRTACALEKLSIGGGVGGDGSGEDVAAIRNALTGDGGTPDIGADGNPADSWASSGGNGSAIEPDTSGYGWGGGSCPSPPAITVLGAVIQFDATPVCNWLGLGSYFVLGLAALASLRIVASKEA